MKRKVFIAIISAFAVSFPALAQAPTEPTTALVFSVSFTGTPSGTDVRAARLIVDAENVRLAALDPPGTPLATTPASALKASYLGLLADIITNTHLSYIKQAGKQDERLDLVTLWRDATDAQRDSAITALGGTP